jgi:hypothetical protein
MTGFDLRPLFRDIIEASDTTSNEKLRAAERLMDLGEGAASDEHTLALARRVLEMDDNELAAAIADMFRPAASAASSLPGPATRAMTFGEQAAARIETLEAAQREDRQALVTVTAERDQLARAVEELRAELRARAPTGRTAPLELPAPPRVP